MAYKSSLSVLVLIIALGAAMPADSRGNMPRGGGFSSGRSFRAGRPTVINMSHGASGWHNRNFPSSHPSRFFSGGRSGFRPSYGQLHWNRTSIQRTQRSYWTPSSNGWASSRPSLGAYRASGVRAGVVVHHPAYAQGYVRQRLRQIGVTSEPSLITDRAEMVRTDRRHSSIQLPRQGPGGTALNARIISPRHFNDPMVRRQMERLNGSDWNARIDRFNSSEYSTNHYYWHQNGGLNYCHYIDKSGYSWWGWYSGDRCFWTRHYAGRWWWYDQDYNRWCFWNGDDWWWQDPDHMGDLYCYDNDEYIPCGSEDDQEVVTTADLSGEQTYTSPDGTRMVKVIGESRDAFLYDTANPPTFEPVYLASGVRQVDFSNAAGRPLEVVLKLEDGSFDLFDGYGNSYNPPGDLAAAPTQ